MEQEALEHAIRCWQAEEENARRIAGRKALLVGVPAGLLAFAGARADRIGELLGWALDAHHGQRALAWFALLLLAAGLSCFLASAALAIGVRRSALARTRPASRHLHPISAQALRDFAEADAQGARELAFTRTIAAARGLLESNCDVEQRLFMAGGWLVSGVLFCFLALVAYAWLAR
jgi:hypothetical protein